MRGDGADGLVEGFDRHALVDTDADGDAWVFVLEAHVGQVGEGLAVGLAEAGFEAEVLDGVEAGHWVEAVGPEDATVEDRRVLRGLRSSR